jgi:hypothetical protein
MFTEPLPGHSYIHFISIHNCCKEDDIGRACSTNGGAEECIQDIGGMDLREIGWDGMDWIELAQDKDQWGALVNTVMNLRVP